MAFYLLLVLIGLPIVEIAVFIEAGGLIGLWPTLAVVVVTAVAGTALLRWQGLATLARARASLDRGELPLAETFDGVCLLIAAVVLMTPGFVTDAAGLALLFPPVRRALRGWVARRFLADGEIRVGGRAFGAGPGGGAGPADPASGPVIEGEYDEVREPD